MRDFVFHAPTKIMFGPGELDHLGEEVAAIGTKVLLCYGGGSIKSTGLYDRIMGLLRAQDCEVWELAGIEPNPRIQSVREGARLCKDHDIDVVLAVGGGSTFDCAKFVCAGALTDTDPWEWFEDQDLPIERALPLVGVLTLAATGSEMDAGGVITNPERKRKLGRSAAVLTPQVSFLDPELTFTVSPYQTACGAADILSHTFETYFSMDGDLYFLDQFMEGLIRTVIKYAPIAIAHPDDYDARANLMWASTWAINGFASGGKTQAWSCHPMEHELSAYYDITHGLGLAILTPRWMEYVLDEETLPKFVQFARNVFSITDPSMTDEEVAQAGIDAIADFLSEGLGLESHLSALGIDDQNFQLMAEGACKGGAIEGFRRLTPEDVVEIYEACL